MYRRVEEEGRQTANVELHTLIFVEAAESACLNRREVNENIFAVLAADETIAFGIVKPLYCSCFHLVACSFCVEIALKLADFCRQVTLWSGETA